MGHTHTWTGYVIDAKEITHRLVEAYIRYIWVRLKPACYGYGEIDETRDDVMAYKCLAYYLPFVLGIIMGSGEIEDYNDTLWKINCAPWK